MKRRADSGAETPFIFATVRRVAADFRKKHCRNREELGTDALVMHESSWPSVEELIDQGRARDLLDVVLSEMPESLRTVFILFEFEDLTMAKIAEMLSLPLGTVASRLRRARSAFEIEAARVSARLTRLP